MRVNWLDLAVGDLEDISGYISEDNPEAAKRIASRLWTAVRTLADQPEMLLPGRL
jgi:plasmid stabilization system protein ParE